MGAAHTSVCFSTAGHSEFRAQPATLVLRLKAYFTEQYAQATLLDVENPKMNEKYAGKCLHYKW